MTTYPHLIIRQCPDCKAQPIKTCELCAGSGVVGIVALSFPLSVRCIGLDEAENEGPAILETQVAYWSKK